MRLTAVAIKQAIGSKRERIMERPEVATELFVLLSAVLFMLGSMGVLLRRNAILIFMSIELMLNSANLALVAFARQWNNMEAHVLVFFVMTVAAAEVAVGLALIVTIYRHKQSTDIDDLHSLQG
jgi:NADH-quinone oxidoreductase subunit K